MPPEDIAALEQTYQSAKVIEIHVWDQPDFLDIEEVRLRLPNWANLFPVLERLEIVDHGTTGWEHRPTSSTIDAIATGHAELREAIMASNPSIKSIHLDVR
ncbi:hypothetical protein AX16_003411 [Volvariella volvacea WC 439]|nr:hypothetical protein AX16_003411 [Volvariella volvacea WC 439]